MNQDTANAIAASVAALTSALRAERDALRAEVEAVNEKWLTAQEGWDASRAMLDRFGALLRAAQSLHRAWRRERDGGERLRAFVSSLRADGLDIDDPDTAPTWTGKVFDGERLLFDLATVAVDAPAPEPTTPGPRTPGSGR